MKKRVVIRKYAIVLSVLMILSVFMLSSCGTPEVKEYMSVHESGTYKINSLADFEKLHFKEKTSPEEIARIIPDFCIYYKQANVNEYTWAATCYVDFVSINKVCKMIICFNEDKKFFAYGIENMSFSDFKSWAEQNVGFEIDYHDKNSTRWLNSFGVYDDEELLFLGEELDYVTIFYMTGDYRKGQN